MKQNPHFHKQKAVESRENPQPNLQIKICMKNLVDHTWGIARLAIVRPETMSDLKRARV